MVDFWCEVYEHVQNRIKQTIASCVGIAWGIFIMVILVGVGNALEHSIIKLFADYNSNSVEVYAGTISMPTDGGVEGATIQFDNEDIVTLRRNVADIEYISPLQSKWMLVKTFERNGTFEIKGVDVDYLEIKKSKIIKGRNLNIADFLDNRRCVVIGKNVESVLFKNCDCVGKSVIINDIPLTVVGVFNESPTAPNDARVIMMSTSNYMSVVEQQPKYTTFIYTAYNNKNVKELVRRQIGMKHRFKPQDEKAVYIASLDDQLKAFDTLFSAIRYFLWFVGISTLVGGVVGISNIMVSTVRERTREIGVRMAVGATPSNIKKLILGESAAITAVAGLGGILLGWGVLQIVNVISSSPDSLLGSPTLDVSTTIFSMIVILISGLVSGLRPAVTAATMRPIEALQAE